MPRSLFMYSIQMIVQSLTEFKAMAFLGIMLHNHQVTKTSKLFHWGLVRKSCVTWLIHLWCLQTLQYESLFIGIDA